MNKILVLLLVIPFLSLAGATNIRGDLYDSNFELVSEALVSITQGGITIQSVAVTDGSYSFDVELGTYIIEAMAFDDGETKLIALEKVEIKGDAVLDLVLLPGFDDELINFQEDNLFDVPKDASSNFLWVIGVVIIALVVYYYRNRILKLFKKANEGDLPKDLKEIVNLMKKHNGRINQLDLRAALPYSEAKVSLMIADLEERGIVRKIKKGRGNILILE